MAEKNKGLADNHDEEFILNESGTSVDNDMDEVDATQHKEQSLSDQQNAEADLTFKTNDPVVSNDMASDEQSRLGEEVIKPYDDVFPDHKAYEDRAEVSGTNDV